jgi:predicted nicotinamide N-methyase
VTITDQVIPGGWSEIEVAIGRHRLRLLTPADPDELLNHLESPEAATRPHLADPYWAKLWPAATHLAEALIREPFPPGTRVLELGCGSGLAGLAALATGCDVTFSDYVPLTVELALENAARNGFANARGMHLDWHSPPDEKFAALIAADVTYDRANIEPLLNVLDSALSPGGVAWFADGGRSPASDFCRRAADRGWLVALYDDRHRATRELTIGRCQRMVLSR